MRVRARTGLLLASLWIGVNPIPVAAQQERSAAELLDMSLEKLLTVQIDSVYSSSKFQQKVTEAPASVTIISAEEIQKFGYQTLADILRDVPGFYVTYDRNYSYLGFRGYGQPGDYNSRVQLLVDGHLLNDDIYGEALLGTEFPVDLDLVDRIEVVRGPNSSLYVASAFFGVINVITKRGGALGGLAVSGAAGSNETYRSRVSYGRDFDNGLEVLLSGSFYASQGADALFFKEFDNPLTNNGIARNADGDQFQQLFANVSYGSFTFQGVYGSRDKHIPTASFGTVFNDPGTHTVDTRSYADLQYQDKIAGGWQLAARLYFDKYDYEGTYIYSSADPDVASTVTQKDLGYGTWLGGEAVVSKKLFDRHHVTVGSSYRQHLHQDQTTYDLQPFSEDVNDRRSSTDWGSYVQDEIRLSGSLILNVGLRYDHYSTFGGSTNPRAALIYNPFEKTTFKLLYGQAFRAPNFYELYYHAPGSEANPFLKPERVKTTELVWEQYLQHRFQFTATGFYYPIRDLISAANGVEAGDIQYQNARALDLRGFDLSFRRRSPWGLEVGGNYSFQVARNHDPADFSVNSPSHLGRAFISAPLIRHALFASFDLQYVSSRKSLANSPLASYALSNFTLLSRSLGEKWDISASIYNIFNRQYGDPGRPENLQDVILQDGRTFRLKVGYSF
ncbi:MAG: TonB-dependent receptor [Acidobacteriia bacterium]|nr:TonB-dependent receptor [Terriglobia bacterium]